jgi:hypothetical protein
MVEARGVEPLSEDVSPGTSPGAVADLGFASLNSRQRDLSYASFIKSHLSQSFDRLVPR